MELEKFIKGCFDNGNVPTFESVYVDVISAEQKEPEEHHKDEVKQIYDKVLKSVMQKKELADNIHNATMARIEQMKADAEKPNFAIRGKETSVKANTAIQG